MINSEQNTKIDKIQQLSVEISAFMKVVRDSCEQNNYYTQLIPLETALKKMKSLIDLIDEIYLEI